MKKRQCITVKLLATVPTLLCENNGWEGKTSCQLESRMVYVKKCIFRHSPLKSALTYTHTKERERERERRAEALHNGQ